MTNRRSLCTIGAASVVATLALCAACFAEDAKPWELRGTKAGQEITGPDGGKMVWVPAGRFVMGSTAADAQDAARLWNGSDTLAGGVQGAQPSDFASEQPVHQVRITRGFWLGRCTVTIAQYRRYCQETGAAVPKGSGESGDYPIAFATWDEAQAYCRHYGLSLPTEAQWEYAARGPEGRRYPWGNEWDPKKCCNRENESPGGNRIADARTFAVGSFPEGASWCGALDLAGNVYQWCKDRWSTDYYANSPTANPPGPDCGERRVVRGGSWLDDAVSCRSAARGGNDPSAHCYGGMGFRCVRTP